jgi:hypothetical protein
VTVQVVRIRHMRVCVLQRFVVVPMTVFSFWHRLVAVVVVAVGMVVCMFMVHGGVPMKVAM